MGSLLGKGKRKSIAATPGPGGGSDSMEGQVRRSLDGGCGRAVDDLSPHQGLVPEALES